MSYFKTLEEIIHMALALQSLPVHTNDVKREIQLLHLKESYHHLHEIFVQQAPEVWCANPKDNHAKLPMAPDIGDPVLVANLLKRTEK